MATKVTSSFWLAETLHLTASNTPVQGQIDLGAYVDVADRQGISVEAIDWIFQPVDTGVVQPSFTTLGGNFMASAQCTDLNRGTVLQAANDRSLVGSGAMSWDNGDTLMTFASDMYPDNYGTLADARTVVSSNLYFVAEADSIVANSLYVTARLKCKIVKLSAKDWMSIAITSTATE